MAGELLLPMWRRLVPPLLLLVAAVTVFRPVSWEGAVTLAVLWVLSLRWPRRTLRGWRTVRDLRRDTPIPDEDDEPVKNHNERWLDLGRM
ncbi:MAG: hypothetical protein ACRDSK_09340 [Actinophytocola sp.]|uniref:hypothetical protein n=1 Tax=Actinophytocola sp. TaxID=1872138 RepID=UPI003D6A948B